MVIYTREFCPNCDKVKDFLKTNNITFEEKDVDYFKNKAKLVVRGLKELPVLNYNNKWIEYEDDIIDTIQKDLL
jgi:glutaredoxin